MASTVAAVAATTQQGKSKKNKILLAVFVLLLAAMGAAIALGVGYDRQANAATEDPGSDGEKAAEVAAAVDCPEEENEPVRRRVRTLTAHEVRAERGAKEDREGKLVDMKERRHLRTSPVMSEKNARRRLIRQLTSETIADEERGRMRRRAEGHLAGKSGKSSEMSGTTDPCPTHSKSSKSTSSKSTCSSSKSGKGSGSKYWWGGDAYYYGGWWGSSKGGKSKSSKSEDMSFSLSLSIPSFSKSGKSKSSKSEDMSFSLSLSLSMPSFSKSGKSKSSKSSTSTTSEDMSLSMSMSMPDLCGCEVCDASEVCDEEKERCVPKECEDGDDCPVGSGCFEVRKKEGKWGGSTTTPATTGATATSTTTNVLRLCLPEPCEGKCKEGEVCTKEQKCVPTPVDEPEDPPQPVVDDSASTGATVATIDTTDSTIAATETTTASVSVDPSVESNAKGDTPTEPDALETVASPTSSPSTYSPTASEFSCGDITCPAGTSCAFNHLPYPHFECLDPPDVSPTVQPSSGPIASPVSSEPTASPASSEVSCGDITCPAGTSCVYIPFPDAYYSCLDAIVRSPTVQPSPGPIASPTSSEPTSSPTASEFPCGDTTCDAGTSCVYVPIPHPHFDCLSQ